jgi:hypothetical protein
MKPADPGKAVDRPPTAPPFGGISPLPGAAVVRHPPARTHRAAVDPARHLRAQLTRDGGGGRLIQQRHALFDPALGHQRPTLQVQPHRLEIRDTEGGAQLQGPPARRRRHVQIPASKRGHATHHRQQSVHGLLGRSLQEALGPIHPPVEHRGKAGPQQVEGQLRGRIRRGQRVPRLCMQRVGTLPGVTGGVLLADPPSRLRQHLQVVGGQVPGVVGVGHDLIGLTPGMPVERRTGPLTWGFLNDRAHRAPSLLPRSL